jgi:hypothetical protein
MERVYVREELDTPIDPVWNLIRDFADISAWAQGRVIRVDGAGVGMVRHIDGPAGRFVERCEVHDEAAYTFSYRLLESPLPVTNYLASVRLSAAGSSGCAIEWMAEFTANDPSAGPAIRTRLENAFRGVFIRKLRETVARSMSGGTHD